jgi:multiple antibiotic resistance protein
MRHELTLFVSTFTTLLAIINPLEALPVFLKLLDGKDESEHRLVARKSCIYALLLILFFLVFGTLMLRLFDVRLSMIRIWRNRLNADRLPTLFAVPIRWRGRVNPRCGHRR